VDKIKVFIVEDESIVREGLRDMIPWAQYGFEFVGDAPDGEMALPMIRRFNPDILITDIKMPFMDGLELSEIVGKEMPNMKIIILSGYNDFEYAKKAIDLRVDQFLLKPITKTSMIEALEQTKRNIEEEAEQRDYMLKYEQDFKKYERLNQRVFFEQLVEGALSIQEIYSEAEKLKLDLNADMYNLVLFSIQGADETAYYEAAADIQERLVDYFLRYPDFLLFRSSLTSYSVIVKGDMDNIDSMTEKCVETITNRCEGVEGLNWFISVGKPTNRLSGIPKCYADANHALAYRHILPNKHVYTTELIETEKSDSQEDLQDLNPDRIDPLVIRSFIQTGTLSEIDSFVHEYLGNLGSAVHSVIFRHYLMMSVRINAEVVLKELGCDIAEYRKSIPSADINMQAEELDVYLLSVLRPALEAREQMVQFNSRDVVDEAMAYIDENYTDANISLNLVAQKINISANYLSALFSQKTDMSFIEYITRKRMEKAKQLLRQTQKKPSEISSEIGYKDPRYFSFVFKRTQGCTPKAYRSDGQE